MFRPRLESLEGRDLPSALFPPKASLPVLAGEATALSGSAEGRYGIVITNGIPGRNAPSHTLRLSGTATLASSDMVLSAAISTNGTEIMTLSNGAGTISLTLSGPYPREGTHSVTTYSYSGVGSGVFAGQTFSGTFTLTLDGHGGFTGTF